MTRRRASFRSELPVERNWPSKVRTVIRIAREETVSKLIACRALEKSGIAVQSYFDPILAADSDGGAPPRCNNSLAACALPQLLPERHVAPGTYFLRKRSLWHGREIFYPR